MATSAITGLTDEEEFQRRLTQHKRGESVLDTFKSFVDPTDPLNYLGPASRMGKLGMGLFGSALALTPREAEASIIGKNAKTWNQRGGEMRDPYNQPFKEISDADSMLNIDNLKKMQYQKVFGAPEPSEAKLGDILNHPELFEAYPQLKDYDVYKTNPFGGYDAAYFPSKKAIEIRGNNPYFPSSQNESISKELKKIHSDLMHEVTHAIQQIENFSPGGSPAEFTKKSTLKAKELIKEADDSFDEAVYKTLGELNVKISDIPKTKQLIDDAAFYTVYKKMPESFPAEYEDDLIEFIKTMPQELKPLFDSRLRISKTKAKVYDRDVGDADKYKRLAGEAQARAVSKRIEEPWRVEQEPFMNSYDVSREQLIYKDPFKRSIK